MQRQTRLCVSVSRAHLAPRRIESLAQSGADAFLIPIGPDGLAWAKQLITQVRDAEVLLGRPFAVILDLVQRDDELETIANLIHGEDWSEIDFLAISCELGSGELERLRTAFRDDGNGPRLIGKLEHAEHFDQVEGFVKSTDAIMITEVGLRSLAPSAAPIAQKMVSRQCQVAAKPCLVTRNISNVIAHDHEQDLAAVFDLANAAFDHVDCVVITETPSNHDDVGTLLNAASEILINAECYLELNDRPVRVGFGQPPHTASLAYAIRHILKLQEIAAVAVYSLTGSTARVIAKNWIACPILAFSSRPATARTMCLYHGVISRHVEAQFDSANLLETAGTLAKQLDIAAPGDHIIVVSGHPDQSRDQANGFIVEAIS